MDDLRFRRSLFADPTNDDDEQLTALSADPAKKKLAQEVNALDEKIFSALNVPVPDGLAQKLLLKQTLASHQHKKRKTRIQFALAASVMLTLGVTFSLMQFSHAYKSISDYALAHVAHEEKFFNNNDIARVNLVNLNQKMASFNATFTDDLGELIAANFCKFDGIKSLHLVFKGKTSPITIFVVPNNEYLNLNNHFESETMQGLVSTYKNNNVIIVGNKSEPLKNWQAKINQKIRWST
ncbi:DUF3379 family protein [Thalassotalea piscium]|uniref:DUF3379 domain-containing protein n=1 Tax=Thalassotalea piscium TaxID=1230533 RepID=A0A7X0NE93_9GAMM|nr:DUF3379 family protein [Thalassotalea piscium]MBB6541841.1 hypothetical protein [Thalassotalea piscium]